MVSVSSLELTAKNCSQGVTDLEKHPEQWECTVQGQSYWPGGPKLAWKHMSPAHTKIHQKWTTHCRHVVWSFTGHFPRKVTRLIVVRELNQPFLCRHHYQIKDLLIRGTPQSNTWILWLAVLGFSGLWRWSAQCGTQGPYGRTLQGTEACLLYPAWLYQPDQRSGSGLTTGEWNQHVRW